MLTKQVIFLFSFYTKKQTPSGRRKSTEKKKRKKIADEGNKSMKLKRIINTNSKGIDPF